MENPPTVTAKNDKVLYPVMVRNDKVIFTVMVRRDKVPT